MPEKLRDMPHYLTVLVLEVRQPEDAGYAAAPHGATCPNNWIRSSTSQLTAGHLYAIIDQKHRMPPETSQEYASPKILETHPSTLPSQQHVRHARSSYVLQ